MAGDEERLVVLVEARVRDLERNMQKAERAGTKTFTRLKKDSSSATRAMEQDMVRSTARMNEALATTSSRIGSFGKAFVGGLAVGAVTTGLAMVTTNVQQTIKAVASLGDEAKRAGMTLDSFQEWKFVAEQNRIGVDSLVDGFKELNLRADEFVVTGAGSAAEAFQRLGYTGADLSRKLKDPSKLMLEIIGRMKDLDKAAQIRISDELFGGSAGERFVELIGQGEDGLRRTIDRAHELGAVLNAETVAQAAALDRKFGEVTARLDSWLKQRAVAMAENIGIITNVDTMMGGPDAAAGQLGKETRDALATNGAAMDAAKGDVEELRALYDALARDVVSAATAIGNEVPMLLEVGADDLALELADVTAQMEDLVAGVESGRVPAEDLGEKMQELVTRASAALTKAQEIDGVKLDNAVDAVSRLSGALSAALSWATDVVDKVREIANLPPVSAGGTTVDTEDPRTHHPQGGLYAPATSPRPQAPGFDALGDWEARRDAALKAQARSGGGGGKGKPKVDDYTAQAASIREQTAALEAEAVALLAVATSGKDYGDAVEYARTRAELLQAAQKAGKEITPQLTAEIDKLAASYVTAGDAADKAAERLDQIKANGERGAEAITGIFTSLLSGASSAKEALAGLLIEMAKIQFQKAMLGLAAGPGGGFFAGLGGLLSYDTGGYTGAGGRREPAGVVHRGEVVWSQDDVRRAGGVATVEAMRRGLGGYESGGAVGGGSMSGPAPALDINVHVTASFDETGNLYVRQVARDEAGRATKAERKALPHLLQEYNRNPHKRF